MRGKKRVKMKRLRSDSKGNKTESLGQKVGRGEEKGDDQIRLSSHDAGFGCASRWSKTTQLLIGGAIDVGSIGSRDYSPRSEFLSDREDPVSTTEQWADLASN
jgi:hypothetical protein